MTDTPDSHPDLCPELTPRGPTEPDPALRQALLRRTVGVLRRRQWRKRLAFAAALAACYAAGVLTVLLAVPPALAPDNPPVATRPTQPPPPETAPAAQKDTAAPAVLLEAQALDAQERQAALYRVAGDRYAEAEGDVQSALRCYRNALDAGSEEDLAIAPDDNWLLMVLKDARQKERRYAKNNE
jgi:hypothetical protein